MDVAYKIYNNSSKLVAVVFPSDGGGPLLRKRWDLRDIGLASATNIPENVNVPSEKYKIQNEKTLVRGGLEIIIDYEKEFLTVTANNIQKNPVSDITYRFNDIGVIDNRISEIHKAQDKRTLLALKNRKSLSD